MTLEKLKELDPSTFFMRVAIPDASRPQYVCNWSAQDLIEASIRWEETNPAAQIEDKAKPTLNPKKKKAKGKAEGSA